MTHTSEQITLSATLRPDENFGALAILLGHVPFATWVFPRRASILSTDAIGLYPAADAATSLAIRAGVRAGHW